MAKEIVFKCDCCGKLIENKEPPRSYYDWKNTLQNGSRLSINIFDNSNSDFKDILENFLLCIECGKIFIVKINEIIKNTKKEGIL